MEEAGIFIFKRSFKQREISGFCLIDIEFPIIYINNSTEKSRQIFTIFHELAHILLQTNGITKSDDRYINSLQGENKYIEIFCNKFAAEFLLPNHVFSEIIRETIVNVNDNDKIISKISSDYKVSREVVLRKLLDNNLISQKEYTLKVNEWYSEQQQLLDKFLKIPGQETIFTLPQQSKEPLGGEALDQIMSQIKIIEKVEFTPPPTIQWPQKILPSFSDFIDDKRQLIIIGGKGGVGKTTVAAAIGWALVWDSCEPKIVAARPVPKKPPP